MILLVISLLAIVLAPLAATLVQLAISRQREFLADASSVELTRNPQGMINALQKLDNSQPMSHHVMMLVVPFISTILKKEVFLKNYSTLIHPFQND